MFCFALNHDFEIERGVYFGGLECFVYTNMLLVVERCIMHNVHLIIPVYSKIWHLIYLIVPIAQVLSLCVRLVVGIWLSYKFQVLEILDCPAVIELGIICIESAVNSFWCLHCFGFFSYDLSRSLAFRPIWRCSLSLLSIGPYRCFVQEHQACRTFHYIMDSCAWKFGFLFSILSL